jgi:hypothetical protein
MTHFKARFMKVTTFLLSIALFACQSIPENENLTHFTLRSNIVVVLSEGRLEPRSVGSYSLRVYEVLTPQFPYDNFITGVIESREGSVEALKGLDITGDGNCELVVITRSAGSGSYASAIAYQYDGSNLHTIASALNLNPDEDIIKSLRSNYDKKFGKVFNNPLSWNTACGIGMVK